MDAKTKAITLVLEKDTTDADNIKADYDAATKEIEARQAFQAKTATWEANKLALDKFSGRVTIDSGVDDVEGTKDIQENKKNIDLLKGGQGKLEIAKAALQAAKDKQSEIATALQKANDVYSHWETELATEKGLQGGLATTTSNKKGELDSANNDVKTYTDAVTTKTTAYDEKLADYNTKKARSDKLKAEVDRIQALIDGSTADAGTVTWTSELTAFKAQAKLVKEKYAAFLVDLAKKQGDAVGDYTAFTTGKTCKTATKNNAKNAATTLAACRTACKNAKYLKFFTGYDAGKTDYVTEFKNYYDKEGDPAGSNDGTAGPYFYDDSANPGGCTGFLFNSGTNECWLWDKAIPEENDAGGDDASDTCYKRLAVDEWTNVSTKWKAYWVVRGGDYRTTKKSYEDKLTSDWAAYDAKQQAERKRLQLVEQYKLEKAKAQK